MLLASHPAFHGALTRFDCEQRLRSHPDGTYMFRLSESHVGCSISVNCPGTIKHFKLDAIERQGVWFFNVVGKDCIFHDIKDLIEFYSTNPTSSIDG